MDNVLGYSGGKDSTAMAYRMAELGEKFSLLFTPTGNESPALVHHVTRVVADLGVELVVPSGPKLEQLITELGGLPNWRQRWCTRMIKIEPCIAWLRQHPNTILCVGLRADEELRDGLYDSFTTCRYPLREWAWGIAEVTDYLAARGIRIPRRTDCLLCYGQRLSEWYALWKWHPAAYARGEALEAQTGHTFRSAGRDAWPAGLRELRGVFESGRRPRVFSSYEAEDGACRVCKF